MNKPGVTFNPDTSTLTVALGNESYMKEISLAVPAKVITLLIAALTEGVDVTVYLPGSASVWIEIQHVTSTDPDDALDIRVGAHPPGGEGTAWAQGSNEALLASLEAVKND